MWNTIKKGLGVAVTGVGILVIVIAFFCIGIYCWQRGWLEQGVKSLSREKEVAMPVGIHLFGPTVCRRGDHTYFHAVVEGGGGRPIWKVAPPTAGALMVMEDGLTAEFRSLDAGTFSITVAVAGDAKTVASDHIEIENIDMVATSSINLAQVAQAAQGVPETQPAETMATPVPTVGDLILDAYDKLESRDRAAEARVVAGSIRTVINRVDTGLLAPDVDPWLVAEVQIKAALGGRSGGWASFFVDARVIMQALRQQGDITTASSAVPTLTEIANTLQHVE